MITYHSGISTSLARSLARSLLLYHFPVQYFIMNISHRKLSTVSQEEQSPENVLLLRIAESQEENGRSVRLRRNFAHFLINSFYKTDVRLPTEIRFRGIRVVSVYGRISGGTDFSLVAPALVYNTLSCTGKNHGISQKETTGPRFVDCL